MRHALFIFWAYYDAMERSGQPENRSKLVRGLLGYQQNRTYSDVARSGHCNRRSERLKEVSYIIYVSYLNARRSGQGDLRSNIRSDYLMIPKIPFIRAHRLQIPTNRGQKGQERFYTISRPTVRAGKGQVKVGKGQIREPLVCLSAP